MGVQVCLDFGELLTNPSWRPKFSRKYKTKAYEIVLSSLGTKILAEQIANVAGFLYPKTQMLLSWSEDYIPKRSIDSIILKRYIVEKVWYSNKFKNISAKDTKKSKITTLGRFKRSLQDQKIGKPVSILKIKQIIQYLDAIYDKELINELETLHTMCFNNYFPEHKYNKLEKDIEIITVKISGNIACLLGGFLPTFMY